MWMQQKKNEKKDASPLAFWVGARCTYLVGIGPAAVPVRGSNRRGVSCVLESNDTCVAYSSVVP